MFFYPGLQLANRILYIYVKTASENTLKKRAVSLLKIGNFNFTFIQALL